MFKVMLDTNILISAALFPCGKAAEAYLRAVLPPFQPFVCDYVIDELNRKFNEKFPDKLPILHNFLTTALNVIQQVINSLTWAAGMTFHLFSLS